MKPIFNQIGKSLLTITIFILTVLSLAWGFYYHFFGIIIVPIAWLLRNPLKRIVNKLGIRGFVGFLFLGWMTSVLEDTMYWLGGWPFFPGYTLLEDFIVMTPAAIIIFLCWWWLNSRYQYTMGEIFVLGGILGIITESLKTIFMFTPLVFSLHCLMFFIQYGWIVMFPFWLMRDHIPKGQKTGFMRYTLGALLPWFGLLIWWQTYVPFIRGWIG